MKKAAGPNGPTAKKKPPAQCREAMESGSFIKISSGKM